jgi:DNA primase
MQNPETNTIILEMLKRIFGNPKRDYTGQTQYEFNCKSPKCKSDNKHNLNYNTDLNIFRCWKCNYKGFIHRIFEDYGTDEDILRIKEIVPRRFGVFKSYSNDNNKHQYNDDIVCELPEGYIPLTGKTKGSKYFYKAIEYLKSRKVDSGMIKKYHIGYTESGPRAFRIIIPSFNKNGDVNYYEARSYLRWIKPTYYKPDSPNKTEIIFNAKNIDFNLPVYITEGVFDMLPLYNCIPLLGKEIPDIILRKIIKYRTKIILCLDDDALKDSVDMSNTLVELNIDVWFVEIKEDVSKFYEKNGKQALIELLRTYRRLDIGYIVSLLARNDGKKKKKHDDKYLEREWQKTKKILMEE